LDFDRCKVPSLPVAGSKGYVANEYKFVPGY
jgi:hypothetical protein